MISLQIFFKKHALFPELFSMSLAAGAKAGAWPNEGDWGVLRERSFVGRGFRFGNCLILYQRGPGNPEKFDDKCIKIREKNSGKVH